LVPVCRPRELVVRRLCVLLLFAEPVPDRLPLDELFLLFPLRVLDEPEPRVLV
jgi:hypothetical protein